MTKIKICGIRILKDALAAIETGVPMLVEARNLVAGFHSMIRKKAADDLEADPGDIEALPEGLRFADDDALRTLLLARRAQDLCP